MRPFDEHLDAGRCPTPVSPSRSTRPSKPSQHLGQRSNAADAGKSDSVHVAKRAPKPPDTARIRITKLRRPGPKLWVLTCCACAVLPTERCHLAHAELLPTYVSQTLPISSARSDGYREPIRRVIRICARVVSESA